MAMSCEQMDAQMIDFLYGEQSVEDRASFQAHLVGCERCRREVESFGRTRTLARAALDEAPPAGARARIVRAAQQAAARAKPAPARASFWDWVRGNWAFPTLATVGALTVFVIGNRVFQRPVEMASSSPTAFEKLRGRASEPSAEIASPAAAARGPGSGGAQEDDRLARAKGEGEGTGAAPEVADRVARDGLFDARKRGGGVGAARGSARRVAPAAAGAAGAAAAQNGLAVGGLGGVEKDNDDPALAKTIATKKMEKKQVFAAPPPPRGDSIARAREERLDQEAGAEAEREPRPGDRNRSGRATGSRDMFADDEGAVARQVPAAAPAPAAPPVAASSARAGSVVADDEAPRRSPMGGAGAAPTPARERAKASASAGASASADFGADAASSVRPGASLARPAKAQAAPRPETLVQRADRLFAARRWAEAAVAYRDLLRNDPDATDASRWRQRLAAAQTAATATTPATASPAAAPSSRP